MATSTNMAISESTSNQGETVYNIIENSGRICQYDDNPLRVVFVDSLPPETIARLMFERSFICDHAFGDNRVGKIRWIYEEVVCRLWA